MPVIFPTQAKVSPSFTEPNIIVTYAQASGAMAVLEGGKPRTKIGSEDMVVYIDRLDLRTDVTTGQSSSNLMPSAVLRMSYDQVPTYLIQTRAIWDHHDVARGGEWNVGVPTAYDLAAFQGIFQQMRTGLLYGFTPGNGEGMLNAPGTTAVTLPPDSFGNSTVSTYDNGQMALFILNQIVALKSGMYQSGNNIKNDVVVLSPQREFLAFQLSGIVQVTSYQRPGAGTDSITGVVEAQLKQTGDTFKWYFDDTLIGQGANGTDAVILTIPEVDAPDMPDFNTNVFGAKFSPQEKAVNLMYQDMAAPMKIPTPIPDGAITQKYELRVTPGWVIRPQGVYVISMQYS